MTEDGKPVLGFYAISSHEIDYRDSPKNMPAPGQVTGIYRPPTSPRSGAKDTTEAATVAIFYPTP